MSTGTKVLIGCLGLVVVLVLALAAIVTIGGLALRRGAESVIATVEEQQEATETLQRIEEAYPFTPPADGVVGEERLDRFLAVTADGWDEMQAWAEDLQEIREAADEERGGLAGLRSIGSGVRALGGLVRSRLALAEALESNDTSLGEYLWTGLQLSRAVEAAEGDRSTAGVPQANLDLVAARGGELPRLDSDSADDSAVVLAVATLWGMTDLSTWQALGLDTLVAQ